MTHSTVNIGITTHCVGDGSVNDRKFGGKELITAKGFDAYDFEARRLTVSIPRFTQPDPMAEKYYPISLYAYCGGDPVNRTDPTGENWYRDNDTGEIRWTNADSQENLDKTIKNATYLGTAQVEFIGSRDEKLGTKNGKEGFIDGEGAVIATVYLYGPKDEQDVYELSGYTMSSDPEKYGVVAEGLYPANYDPKGKSGTIPSHWTLNNKGRVPTMDGKINPYARHQIDAMGNGYLTGIYIHATNQSGFAGDSVSMGCLLLTPKSMELFNSVMKGVRNFTVQVSRYVIVENSNGVKLTQLKRK